MSLCPNKEVCGSCGWSHIPYEKQLQQKLSDINGSFALKELDLQCHKILPSPTTTHYRNRMDFVIEFEGRVGLRQKGKWWRVIDDHQCFLGSPEITELFPIVRQWARTSGLSYYDRKAHTGLLRYAVLRSSSLGQTMITVVTSAVDPSTASTEMEVVRNALRELSTLTDASTVIWSVNHTINDLSVGESLETISGPGYIDERINDWHYRITPNAFFQTNSTAAAVLQRTVVDMIGDVKQKQVLDLYCGSGFFTIPLAAAGAHVTGVEMVAEAIADAQVNAQLNHINAQWQSGESESYIWPHQVDILVLDPPRSGMHDTMIQTIKQHQPSTILYVSCNYKNFSREYALLQDLYQASEQTAVDLFPHTPHVELVTRLELK